MKANNCSHSDCSSRKTSAPLLLYIKLITTNCEEEKERGGKEGQDTKGTRLTDSKRERENKDKIMYGYKRMTGRGGGNMRG